MICGVKYCGGCNPRFNRTNFFNKVKKACPDVEFQYVKPESVYDHLLVIQGCTSKCADLSQIVTHGHTWNIFAEDQYEELIAKLKRF